MTRFAVHARARLDKLLEDVEKSGPPIEFSEEW